MVSSCSFDWGTNPSPCADVTPAYITLLRSLHSLIKFVQLYNALSSYNLQVEPNALYWHVTIIYKTGSQGMQWQIFDVQFRWNYRLYVGGN